MGYSVGLRLTSLSYKGDWSSNSYERYLHPSFQLRKQVANTMGKFAARFTYNHSSTV